LRLSSRFSKGGGKQFLNQVGIYWMVLSSAHASLCLRLEGFQLLALRHAALNIILTSLF